MKPIIELLAFLCVMVVAAFMNRPRTDARTDKDDDPPSPPCQKFADRATATLLDLWSAKRGL